MAKNQKTHKAMGARAKALVGVALLLVVTLVISYFGIATTTLGPEESRKLLPYMPMNGEMEAYTLPVEMNGGVVYEATLPALAEGEESQADKVAAIYEARLASFGVRGYKVEKISDVQVNVTMPAYDTAEMIGTVLSTPGAFTFTDAEGNVYLTNADFSDASVLYSNGYYYMEMKADKAALKAATEATVGSALSIVLDGSTLAEPAVEEVNASGVVTLSFGMDEATTSALCAMLSNDALPVAQASVMMNAVEATAPATLTVLLIALWAVFALAVVLMVVRYRAAGVGAAWTLWAYMLLFFFLMCTVTRVYASYVVWACVFAGMILCVYALSLQLKAAAKAVKEGRDAAAAVRYGMNSTVKKTLITYAVALAVALVLMILNVTRPMGYTLATAVVAGLCATLIAVRLVVPAMVALCGGKSCAVCGK